MEQANIENKNLLNVVNIALYCETCPKCHQPARGEQLYWGLNESILEFFCINPRCINFDGSYLRQKRDQIYRAIRETKSFRRFQKKLWREAAASYKKTGRVY